MAKKLKFYLWKFADGYEVYCAGFDRTEMAHAVQKHGKLISKTPA